MLTVKKQQKTILEIQKKIIASNLSQLQKSIAQQNVVHFLVVMEPGMFVLIAQCISLLPSVQCLVMKEKENESYWYVFLII